MTGTYEWNPMPHVVEIRCPKCSEKSLFEFAEMVMIRRRTEIPFFKRHKLLEYRCFRDRSGNRSHAAIFYAGLNAHNTDALTSLPDGYEHTQWSHSRYLYRGHGLDIGTAMCDVCNLRRKHDLNWPMDAFFQIEYRRSCLWAFHRESAVELRAFIASHDRKPEKFKWGKFLLHVPTHFLHDNARETIVKRLDKVLAQ